jgi:hypothetical protein
MTWLDDLVHDFFIGCALEVLTRGRGNGFYEAQEVLMVHDQGAFGCTLRGAKRAAAETQRRMDFRSAQCFIDRPGDRLARLFKQDE